MILEYSLYALNTQSLNGKKIGWLNAEILSKSSKDTAHVLSCTAYNLQKQTSVEISVKKGKSKAFAARSLKLPICFIAKTKKEHSSRCNNLETFCL